MGASLLPKLELVLKDERELFEQLLLWNTCAHCTIKPSMQ